MVWMQSLMQLLSLETNWAYIPVHNANFIINQGDGQEELIYPEAYAELLFKEFHRTEMFGVLDSLITEYTDNIKVCLDQIKSLADCLQPTVQKQKEETVKAMCCLFSSAC